MIHLVLILDVFFKEKASKKKVFVNARIQKELYSKVLTSFYRKKSKIYLYLMVRSSLPVAKISFFG